jgi:hypothetical protein
MIKHSEKELMTCQPYPIVLSEWTNVKPENIHRMLHNANDYPALKKNLFKVMPKPLRQDILKPNSKTSGKECWQWT